MCRKKIGGRYARARARLARVLGHTFRRFFSYTPFCLLTDEPPRLAVSCRCGTCRTTDERECDTDCRWDFAFFQSF